MSFGFSAGDFLAAIELANKDPEGIRRRAESVQGCLR
jgi:hypothetical protein